ncbi:MAG: hypothetical protein ACR2KZ_18970 [Segetibacter sp.]
MFNKLIFHRHDVKYYQCESCGFIQTEEPFWLDEAYSSAITTLDLGLLQRNLLLVPITSAIILQFFNPSSSFVDYGGGYGVFTRMMRDKGFNFYRQDPHCENIFSKQFDVVDLQENQGLRCLLRLKYLSTWLSHRKNLK